MIYFLEVGSFYLALIYLTWEAFLSVMALKSARDSGKLTTLATYMAYPLLAVAWLLDFSLNMAATPVFLDLPREWLLTIRCDRYLSAPASGTLPVYRQRLARFLCKNLLDPFQSGGHCRGIDP